MFCGEKDGDAKSWVEFLQSALNLQNRPRMMSSASLSAFGQDRRVSIVPGGFDDPPDKHGWLKKMGNNMTKDWKKRYVAIKRGKLFYFENYTVSLIIYLKIKK